MTAQPDLSLVAEMLRTPERFLDGSREEQANLCEQADNATGEAVTVSRSRLRRVAAEKGEDAPRFDSPAVEVDEDGAALIAAERQRHQRHPKEGGEGWTRQHDTEHDGEQLAAAAACYAAPAWSALRNSGTPPLMWPWDEQWWKPTPDNRIRELVKAGALCAAEIDRLKAAAIAGKDGAK